MNKKKPRLIQSTVLARQLNKAKLKIEYMFAPNVRMARNNVNKHPPLNSGSKMYETVAMKARQKTLKLITIKDRKILKQRSRCLLI